MRRLQLQARRGSLLLLPRQRLHCLLLLPRLRLRCLLLLPRARLRCLLLPLLVQREGLSLELSDDLVSSLLSGLVFGRAPLLQLLLLSLLVLRYLLYATLRALLIQRLVKYEEKANENVQYFLFTI